MSDPFEIILHPCPFCDTGIFGVDHWSMPGELREHARVCCWECGAQGPEVTATTYAEADGDARMAWNRGLLGVALPGDTPLDRIRRCPILACGHDDHFDAACQVEDCPCGADMTADTRALLAVLGRGWVMSVEEAVARGLEVRDA